MDTVTGSGQESFAGATDATSAARAVAICASLCSQICAADSCAACYAAAPGIVFSSFFGAIMWQILVHKTKTFPVVEPAEAENSIPLLLLLVSGALRLPSLLEHL